MFMQPAQLVSIPSTSLENDPVPADVRALIELFATHLAKVAFPDVDAAALRRDADQLRAQAKTVARAREALAAAIAGADACLTALTDAAARATAYARIYSEAHPDRAPIAAALASLSRPVSEPVKPGKRRGRPPHHTPELFGGAEKIS